MGNEEIDVTREILKACKEAADRNVANAKKALGHAVFMANGIGGGFITSSFINETVGELLNEAVARQKELERELEKCSDQP